MDDLLDLNWSSGASGQKALAQPPLKPTSNAPSGSFDFLAKAATSGPNYHSSTPPFRSSTPLSPAPALQPNAVPSRLTQPKPNGSGASSLASSANPSPNPGSSDAFANLISLAGSGRASPLTKNASLADRQKALAEEKQRKAELERQQFEVHDDVWDTLGSSRATPVMGSSGQIVSRSANSTPFEDVLMPSKSASSSRPPSALGQPEVFEPKPATAKARGGGSLWTNDDFLSVRGQPGPSYVQPKVPIADPYDFDALGESILGGNSIDRGKTGSRTLASDFDLLDGVVPRQAGVDEDQDDFLGELGRPAKPQSSTQSSSVSVPLHSFVSKLIHI